MGEDKDRDRGEVKMNPKAEGEAVGLSPEEVREVNRPKFEKDMTRTHLAKKAANVLAVS